jgi:hypothetical protein
MALIYLVIAGVGFDMLGGSNQLSQGLAASSSSLASIRPDLVYGSSQSYMITFTHVMAVAGTSHDQVGARLRDRFVWQI